MLKTLRRSLTVLMSFSMLAFVLLLAPPMASAGVCDADSDEGSVEVVDCDDEPGHEEGPGGGPSCEIEPGDTGCYNGESCLINDPSTIALESVPEGDLPPKPGDDYHHAFRICETGGPIWYWSQDGGPSVEELAMQAFARLNTPVFTPTFNPPTRTLVNLDTWWWAAGATPQNLSASAGSVTVIAEPSHLEVRPGDGSASFTCAFVTAKSDECTYTYRRASKGDGYAGGMRLVWDLRFTDSDDPIEFDGLPTTLNSPWASVTVPVREVQSTVTGVG